MATAAALPPLDPPVLLFGFQGFRAGPCKIGSVVPALQNSGTLVVPSIVKPALRANRTNRLSCSDFTCRPILQAENELYPRKPPPSFIRNGTPASGPSPEKSTKVLPSRKNLTASPLKKLNSVFLLLMYSAATRLTSLTETRPLRICSRKPTASNAQYS